MTMTVTRADRGTSHNPNLKQGRHRRTRPRSLNLIDLENLVSGHVDTPTVRDAWTELVKIVDLRHDDRTCVAVSRRNAAAAFFGLPAHIQRIVGADGPDGADVALIDAIDYRWAAANFGQVVLASGDHIFAPVADRFRDVGLPVIQVIGGGKSSALLYRASSEHRYLPLARRAAVERRSQSAA